jgi:hypothetical protein
VLLGSPKIYFLGASAGFAGAAGAPGAGAGAAGADTAGASGFLGSSFLQATVKVNATKRTRESNNANAFFILESPPSNQNFPQNWWEAKIYFFYCQEIFLNLRNRKNARRSGSKDDIGNRRGRNSYGCRVDRKRLHKEQGKGINEHR